MADLDTLQSHLILTINGGSSSIKFAIFFADKPPKRIFSGQIDRIGKPGSRLTAKREAGGDKIDQALSTANVVDAVNQLIDFLKKEIGGRTVLAIGHRVVHGGVRLIDHQVITSAVMEELKRAMPMDISHLPAEISLIDEFAKSFTSIPQVACFDTAFHRDLPRMAKLLPIPRKYDEAGIHKFGFHGLSYAYLMQELAEAGKGKVILSHLGSGASMAAVKDGKPFDTSMSFTPTAGIVMGTRPGDFDPGLLVYLMRAGKMSADQLDEFINKKCGLLGISETSSDVRDLIEKSSTDKRAAEAIESFCYHAKKADRRIRRSDGRARHTRICRRNRRTFRRCSSWHLCGSLNFWVSLSITSSMPKRNQSSHLAKAE